MGYLARLAFIIGAAVLFAGCAGSASAPIGAPGAMSDGSYPTPHHKHSETFSFTGDKQQFQVPAGVTQVTVVASGASGSDPYGSGARGLGALVKAVIPVNASETLAVYVGGEGSVGGYSYNGGGFNGGGNGGSYCDFCSEGGGRGGASDVRQGGTSLQNRVVVAAGGGGRGCCKGGAGGAGGKKRGADGANGCCYLGFGYGGGGKGGRRQSGGAGGKGGGSGLCNGHAGDSGSLGTGGDGATGCESGGGGGGGYYGGGGGGAGAEYETTHYANGGGGGGGSSYVEPKALSVAMKKAGAAEGNGTIIISWNK